MLKSLGSGIAGGGGPAAGSDTQIQRNSNGLLAGSAKYTFNPTTNTLTLGATVTTTSIVSPGSFDYLVGTPGVGAQFVHWTVADEFDVTANQINLTTLIGINLTIAGGANCLFSQSGANASFEIDIDFISFFGQVALNESTTAPAIATNGTITTAKIGSARLAPAAAVTGIIMQAGTFGGQICTVINESAAINSITMSASGTSHVANGVTCVIAGLASKSFTWDSSTSLWYPSS